MLVKLLYKPERELQPLERNNKASARKEHNRGRHRFLLQTAGNSGVAVGFV